MVPTREDVASRAIAVIGAGTLGRQIAALFAVRGATVRLHDLNGDVLDRARSDIASWFDEIARTTSEAGNAPPTYTTDLNEALVGAWLVVEAIPERVGLKTQLFGQLDLLAPPDALLVTNSSSFRSSLLISDVERVDRVLNMHFYNYPWRSPGVELMSCGFTDPAAMALLADVLPGFGLEVFAARKESTGFVYNRIWAAIKREALTVVAEGVATHDEVDRLFCLVNGTQMGPFQRMDIVGLDVVLDIEDHYAAERPGIPEAPRELLRSMVTAGKLGAKTGEGFYKY